MSNASKRIVDQKSRIDRSESDNNFLARNHYNK